MLTSSYFGLLRLTSAYFGLLSRTPDFAARGNRHSRMPSRGRKVDLDGSPGTLERRLKDRKRKQEQRSRAASGRSNKVGKPSKQPVADHHSKAAVFVLLSTASAVDEVAAGMSSSKQPSAAKRQNPPTVPRLVNKPLTPDGDLAEVEVAPWHMPTVATLATVVAPALQWIPEKEPEWQCVVCFDAAADTASAMYMPCCTGHIHAKCLPWPRSVQENGQGRLAAHKCPVCHTYLRSVRDLRYQAPTAAEQRKFRLESPGGVKCQRLSY